MKTILSWLNEQHWFIIAFAFALSLVYWAYGCESQVKSLIDPAKKVNRQELQVEIEYVSGIASTRVADLDKQDEIKQALFDSLTVVSQGGQINSMGVLNLVATIGAISFGLNRNQKLKSANKNNNTTTP